jgi:hypothetical protein
VVEARRPGQEETGGSQQWAMYTTLSQDQAPVKNLCRWFSLRAQCYQDGRQTRHNVQKGGPPARCAPQMGAHGMKNHRRGPLLCAAGLGPIIDQRSVAGNSLPSLGALAPVSAGTGPPRAHSAPSAEGAQSGPGTCCSCGGDSRRG